MAHLARDHVLAGWDFIFDHEKSPLRHIPDFGVRHMVFQMLGWMWAISFSLAIGSYTFLAISVVGHAILIAAVAITVATYTVAAKSPELFAPLAPHMIATGADRQATGPFLTFESFAAATEQMSESLRITRDTMILADFEIPDIRSELAKGGMKIPKPAC